MWYIFLHHISEVGKAGMGIQGKEMKKPQWQLWSKNIGRYERP
jgi:hypothetical protein